MYHPNNKVGITICNIGAVDTEGSRPIQSKINVEWVAPHGKKLRQDYAIDIEVIICICQHAPLTLLYKSYYQEWQKQL